MLFPFGLKKDVFNALLHFYRNKGVYKPSTLNDMHDRDFKTFSLIKFYFPYFLLEKLKLQLIISGRTWFRCERNHFVYLRGIFGRTWFFSTDLTSISA